MARSITVDVAPGILRHFREASGWTVEEVGKKLKVPPEKVGRLESGSVRPTLAQLEKLSEAFKYSTAMFFLDEPPEQRPPADYRFLPDGRTTFDKETLYAIRESRHLQELGLELLGNVGRPAGHTAGRASLDDSPEDAALKHRKMFKLTEDRQRQFRDAGQMFEYLRRALEEANILAFVSMPAEDARGLALAGALPATVAVSSKDAAEARSFALMHEFGHVLLGDASVDMPGPGRGYNDRERWCNRFSSSFLLPDDMARRVFSEHADLSSPETLKRLSGKCKVGKDLLLYKMKSLGCISAQEYEASARYVAAGDAAELPFRAERRRASRLGSAFVSLVADNPDGQHITHADALVYSSVKLKNLDGVIAGARVLTTRAP